MAKSPLPPFPVGEGFRHAFEALSKLEVEVMLVLGMEEKPLSLSAIAEAISQAGLGDKPGKPYPVVRIKGALTDLAERNLVEMEQGRGWRIPLYYGNYVAAFASRLPEHSPAQKALYTEGFFSKRHGYYNPFFRGNMPFIEGKIRALYYLYRLDELEKLHDEVERFRWMMPSLLFLTEPLDHERFERLSLPIRRAAVAAMFYEKLTEIGPLNELIHYLTEKPNPLLIDPTVGRAMGEALLLMGKLESARDYAELLRSGETSMRNPEALAEAAAIQAGGRLFQRSHRRGHRRLRGEPRDPPKGEPEAQDGPARSGLPLLPARPRAARRGGRLRDGESDGKMGCGTRRPRDRDLLFVGQ